MKKFGLILSLLIGFQLHAQETIIQENGLPASAQEFISTHFSDKKIRKIEKQINSTRTEFDVKFVDETEIEFDSSGNWKEVKGKNNTAIPIGFISEKINTYVSQNFANLKISKIEKEIDKIEVELTDGQELDFSSDGEFLRMDKN